MSVTIIDPKFCFQKQLKDMSNAIEELQNSGMAGYDAGTGIDITNATISVKPEFRKYLKTAIIKGADGLFVITLMYTSSNNSLPSDGMELFADMTQDAICIATGTYNHPVQERQVVVQSLTKSTDNIRILGTPVGYGETEWDITLDPEDIYAVNVSLL